MHHRARRQSPERNVVTVATWFYELSRGDLTAAALPLIRRAHEAGGGVLVVAPDEATARRLDDLLWTFDDAAFLPHGLDTAPYPERQPVLLTLDPAREARGAFVIRLATAPWSGSGSRLSRIMVLFDNEDPVQSARVERERREASAAGQAVEHWRHTGGGWRRSADGCG
jgi:DNA polymerase-3 subunit chi